MFIKYLLSASIIVASSFVNAADWKEVGTSSNTSVKMFHDVDSFRKTNNEVMYWLKVVYSKPRQLYVDDATRGNFDSVMYFVTLDCKNRMVKFSDMNFYMNSKKVRSEVGSKAGYQNIQPDSAPEADWKKFCK